MLILALAYLGAYLGIGSHVIPPYFQVALYQAL